MFSFFSYIGIITAGREKDSYLAYVQSRIQDNVLCSVHSDRRKQREKEYPHQNSALVKPRGLCYALEQNNLVFGLYFALCTPQ